MQTVTFYSYKGGVGRTSALMNIAYRLSERRKSVFILDFDLEAPGIDSFGSSFSTSKPGLLEFLNRYIETGEVPPLQEYVSEVPLVDGDYGNLYFMSSGWRGAKYQEQLAGLNWKDFYSRRHGYLFVENLKAAITTCYSPDYVLVDSRTG